VDYASREFTIVLSKTMKKGPKVMLEAKVNLAITVICKPSYNSACHSVFSHSQTVHLSHFRISMEYPLKPPLFILRLLSEKFETFKWRNDFSCDGS
jgi:THO complex subunit 5